jgi:hypothetical protein
VKRDKITADQFMPTLLANLDNPKLSDSEFREFLRRSVEIVEVKRAPAAANG